MRCNVVAVAPYVSWIEQITLQLPAGGVHRYVLLSAALLRALEVPEETWKRMGRQEAW